MSLVESKERLAALPLKEGTGPSHARDPLVDIQGRISQQIRVGWLIIVVFFSGSGLWLSLAPLNAGAYAPGRIIAESRRKPIQHLEGGIVEEVLVTDGSTVKAGDVLLRLRPTQARASVELLQQRLRQAETLSVRLMAERDAAQKISWPAELQEQASGESELARLMQAQEQVFVARQASFVDQIGILEQRNLQARESVRGLEQQIKARRVQASLLDDEIATVQQLLTSGNAIKPRLLNLQRSRAEIDSTIASLISAIAQTKERIGETDFQITATRSERMKEILTQLRAAESEVGDLRERVIAAQDVLQRVDIVAPQDGAVVNLRFFAKGQVVRPSEPLLDLVPVNDAMIIAARLRPEDIDVVHAGMIATVRFTALGRKYNIPLKGEVVYLSADSAQDERTGLYYYTTHVRIPPEEIKKIDLKVLIPGSPAVVMIETGERTAFEYLFSPFAQSWDRAFRED